MEANMLGRVSANKINTAGDPLLAAQRDRAHFPPAGTTGRTLVSRSWDEVAEDGRFYLAGEREKKQLR